MAWTEVGLETLTTDVPHGLDEWGIRDADHYRQLLEKAPTEVLLVSCAHKLHNEQATVADQRVMGNALFDRLTGRREGMLWYYESLAEVFGRRPKWLWAEISRTVETMTELAG